MGARIFLKEPFGLLEVFVALLTFTGVILIARPTAFFPEKVASSEDEVHYQWDLSRVAVICIGVLGAIASAATNLIVRKLVDVHAMVTMSYLFFVACLVSPF